MTPQEIFDKAVLHIYTMPGQCSVTACYPKKKGQPQKGVNICRYRRADGNKCVVGIFIADEDYDPRMDQKIPRSGVVEEFASAEFGGSVRDLITHARKGRIRLSADIIENVELFDELQNAHDTDANWSSSKSSPSWAMMTALSKIAHKFRLNDAALRTYSFMLWNPTTPAPAGDSVHG